MKSWEKMTTWERIQGVLVVAVLVLSIMFGSKGLFMFIQIIKDL